MKLFMLCAVEFAILSLLVVLLLKLQKKEKWPWTIQNNVKRAGTIGIMFGIIGVLFLEVGLRKFSELVVMSDAVLMVASLCFEPGAGLVTGIILSLDWVVIAQSMGGMESIALPACLSSIVNAMVCYFVRKKFYGNRRVGPLYCVMIAAVVGAISTILLLASTLRSKEVAVAFILIKYFSGISIAANLIAIVILSFFIGKWYGDKFIKSAKETTITDSVQLRLVCAIIIAFGITSVVTVAVENELCLEQSELTMTYALHDMRNEINGFSEDAIKDDVLSAVSYINSGGSLSAALDKYNACEINILDESGKVIDSTLAERIGQTLKDAETKYEISVINEGEAYYGKYQKSRYNSKVERKYVDYRTENGYIELGYDASYFQPSIENKVRYVATNRHVGQNGYIVVLDKEWKIVSADTTFIENLGEDYFSKRSDETNEKEENVRYETTIKDTSYFYMIAHIEGYSVSAMLPKEEVYEMIWKFIVLAITLQIIVFAVLYVIIFRILEKIIIGNIHKVNSSLNKITEGELEEKVDVYTNLEFAELSDDINATVDALKGYIHDAETRIDSELEFARTIQSSALPNSDPAFPNRTDFEIYAIMNAAKEVGGDFYDFYLTHRYILNFLVADVSGKSIPGALFMMKAKGEIKSLRENGHQVDECFKLANNNLCEGNDAEMFVTAWMATINLKYGNLYYANAGHNPPLIKRVGGQWEYVQGKVNLVLAAMENTKYAKQELQLEPGDEVMLYTDGVTEATNINNELYGEQRLVDFINSCEYESMKDLSVQVRDDVMRFTGEADQFDDITILGFRYIGNEPILRIHEEEADISDIPRITDMVEETLNQIDCPWKAIVQINIAIDELFSNIAKFAYGKSKGPATVEIEKTQEVPGIILTFKDKGKPFNPFARKDPNVNLSAEARKIGGLGIYMVKNQMDDLHYEYRDGQNVVRLVKFFGDVKKKGRLFDE